MFQTPRTFKLIVLGMAVVLASCAGPKPEPIIVPPPTPTPIPAPEPVKPPEKLLENPRLSTLPGWNETGAEMLIKAGLQTCLFKAGSVYKSVCAQIKQLDKADEIAVKAFFNETFRAVEIDGEGLMTGYYVPDIEARRVKTEEFSQPVRARPADLVYIDGAKLTPPSTAKKIAARKEGDLFVPYYSRETIETWPDPVDAYYMRPEDYFFMQLQGSGFLNLPDKKRVYAAYGVDNGLPFVGIAKVLVEKGHLKPNETSGSKIHKWLADNRGEKAREIMNANPRYAFFEVKPNQTHAIGAAGVPLEAKSAIAVDPSLNALGTLFWIKADVPSLPGAFPTYQGLVAALDTGGAIKGKIRADYYLGIGKEAGNEAGNIKHRLKFWQIVLFDGQ